MDTKGLYGKYVVQKTDGTSIDPDAQYFVLRLDTDRHAREAMRAYAESVKNENIQLSYEIGTWLHDILVGMDKDEN